MDGFKKKENRLQIYYFANEIGKFNLSIVIILGVFCFLLNFGVFLNIEKYYF